MTSRDFPASSDPALAGDHDCHGCPLGADRRTFLRHTAEQVGHTFLAAGLFLGVARALSAESLQGGSADSKTYAIPPADGVQIDRDNEVILVRWLGSVYAFSLRCPHQNTALRWLEKDEHFQCPKHRSVYAADGYFIDGRATRGMDRYAIRRAENSVVVDLGTIYKESDDAKVWEAAAVKL